MWDRHAQEIRWVVAVSASIAIANAALNAAISEYPGQRITRFVKARIFRRQDRMRAKDREVAEFVFDKNKRREAEIADAIRQEDARHKAALENMHRLRELRLKRDGNNHLQREKRTTPPADLTN